MAVVRNKTDRRLALFRSDAPPVDAGGEATLRDEVFAERAWPTSTWELVEPPGSDYIDASTDEAYLWVKPPDDPDVYDPGAHGVGEVVEYLEGADEGERARVIAVEAASSKPRKTITDWSEN